MDAKGGIENHHYPTREEMIKDWEFTHFNRVTNEHHPGGPGQRHFSFVVRGAICMVRIIFLSQFDAR